MKLLLSRALGIVSPDHQSENAIGAYRFALSRCWQQMELLLGPLGARAIVGHAIKVTSGHRQGIVGVAVGERGADLSMLETALTGEDPRELCADLEELCAAIFLTLRELTGNVLVGPLLDEFQRRRDRSM